MLTDPTYLRYIVDGLDNQTIQQENISALPQGLIGIYEEAIPWEQNIKKRGRLLEFFSVWALLKKEVSANLVAHLLNWPEEKVVDEIAVYSKWFNSPTSGAYILYHERLRAFLLTKITTNQLHQTNSKIIAACQHALESRKADEWETYALEHLPAHLLISAMQDEEQGASFRKLVYDSAYWNRQLEISKGFDWSKKMLNLALGWAAKQSTDELVECALNKIDLNYMEQNDAPRIVELVAQNDIDTALQRIESCGGNDKEGLQKKFTLYMLCLMELTLLNSKDKPFRKTAIDKLLNHLDENIPVDHSLLKWKDFFPSYLMFQMTCQWAEMDLDYLRVYKKTDEWSQGWIDVLGPYSPKELEIIMACVFDMSDGYGKCVENARISTELSKQGSGELSNSIKEQAILCTTKISDEWVKNGAFVNISTELAKQGFFEDSISFSQRISYDLLQRDALVSISKELASKGRFQDAHRCALNIIDDDGMTDVLQSISIELAKQAKFKEALSYINELKDEYDKGRLLVEISIELSKQGQFDAALINAHAISDEADKTEALAAISTELFKGNQLGASSLVMQEAISCAIGIKSKSSISYAYSKISLELTRQSKFDEAFSIANRINDDFFKRSTLFDNSVEIAKQGKFEDAIFFARLIRTDFEERIDDEYSKNHALFVISSELAKQKQVEGVYSAIVESLFCTSGINDKLIRCRSLVSVSKILLNLGHENEYSFAMRESISIARGIEEEYAKSVALGEISSEILKQGQEDLASSLMDEALVFAQDICNYTFIRSTFLSITLELARQANFEKALSCAHGIKFKSVKGSALVLISNELVKQGKMDKASTVMNEALYIARSISNEQDKNATLIDISTGLAEQGKVEAALAVMKETENLSVTSGIGNKLNKTCAIIAISTQIFKQKMLSEALTYIRVIGDKSDKCRALVAISVELFKQDQLQASLTVLQEALSCARGISSESQKSSALRDISIELAKQGKVEEAEEIGLEIPQNAERHSCWKDHAKTALERNSSKSALSAVQVYKSDEARLFYLKGWSEKVSVNEVNAEYLKEAFPYLVNDTESIESLLQRFAQQEILLGHPTQLKKERLNRTLNVQWLIDIAANFPH